MTATRLETHRVDKVWGRYHLGPGFGDVAPGGAPVGEIWFQDDRDDAELLVKYLFTSEKLSIQVHPDDEAARTHGYPRGKDEAWLILDADPGATIAIGTREVMTADELRAADLDGTIEDLVDWKAVKAGDVFYSPAGTIHAIGAGLTLIEVQQNIDLTYRLYDYGRPRDLHLDDGIAVSKPVPYVAPTVPRALCDRRTILVEGAKFVLEHWRGPLSGPVAVDPARPLWLIPVIGGGTLDGARFTAGEVWRADTHALLTLDDGAGLLIAYPGKSIIDGLFPPR